MTNRRINELLGITEERMDKLIHMVQHKKIDEASWEGVISKVIKDVGAKGEDVALGWILAMAYFQQYQDHFKED